MVGRAVARTAEPVVYVRAATVRVEEAHARVGLVAPLGVDELLAGRRLVHAHHEVDVLVDLALFDFDLLKDGVLVRELALHALVLPHVVHDVRQAC